MHFSLTGIIATLIVLSIMVFIHELGHFLVAKACRVKVEVFSIGMGKRLFGYKYGDTDYRVSLLPIGGYVMMAGELPTQEATGAANEFATHPRWQRVLIALAGPTANFLLAIALLTGVYMANPDWENFSQQFAVTANQPVQADVVRQGSAPQPVKFLATSPDVVAQGFMPVATDMPLDIESVEDGSPAATAGMKPGDRIVSINGMPVHSSPVFIAYLQDQKGAPATIAVRRNGADQNIRVTPKFFSDAGTTAWRVGIRLSPPPVHIEKQSFPAAVKHSTATNVASSTLIFEVLHRMFTFKMSPKNVDGPIGIWRETSRAVAMPGWTPLVVLMSVISLNLGIFNLLPFPILDGGVIVFLIIESILRRDLPTAAKERIYQGAFVVLMLLTVLVVFNDLSKTSLFHHLH